MKVLKKTGTVEPQDWERRQRRTTTCGGAAARSPATNCVLGFDVPKAGKYRVFGRFLKAVDYGIVQLAVNGEKAGEADRLLQPGVILTDEIPLGTFELREGQNVLSATVVGANEKAQKAYMFGLDYLVLKPAP